MKALLWGRIVHLNYNYKVYLLMFVLPIIFFLAFGLTAQESKVNIIITDEEETAFSEKIITELSESKPFNVHVLSRDSLYRNISEGNSEVGLIIEKGSFEEGRALKLVKIKDSVAIASFEGTLRSVIQKVQYEKTLTIEIVNVISSLNKNDPIDAVYSHVSNSVNEKLNGKMPIRTVVNDQISEGFAYDHQLQVMLGFMLFFTIYTIMFSIGEIMNDKKHGVWNRLIISPLTKLQLYFGNFLFSFTIGFAQMLLLILLSKFIIGINWSEQLILVFIILACYIFSIMAIGMFLVSVSKNIQQLNSIVPIIAVSMAMLGGAFWPMEIVTAKALVLLSKINPVTYGMQAIKDVVILDGSWNSIVVPCAILLLIGLIFMSIGVRLMEHKTDE
ncbi:ABC transporter permease [Anaerobacillus isosaccharinicus]|uniref:ABC transporter permease n=1 Tax=Anaerobacillus isosaccharinicus TaxID=1532552 RepID=A0A1S2LGQ3_9BACI|nr:ABC transporter permease [Anaerobacillus isosaccharinicus]MBA5586905.1 ABC transporter permease [Anaerobacillus isosaccharinicus]QOY34886.1 ABC transporter permease [Anaerobacillus isosaccharinicus]